MAGNDNKVREITEFSATGVEKVMGGFRTVTDAASGLMHQLGQLAAIAGPVSAALASIGGAITAHKILEVGSAYENVQSRMAGTLTALGFAKDFDDGLKAASHSMDSIYAAAAKLPGEAEDYIEVFTANLPGLQESIKGGLDEYLAFSNKFTAVAKSLQIDTMQTSNDMMRLLQAGRGGAGMDVRTWQKLLPFMKQVQGQANLTGEAFNRMSQSKRAELLQKTLEKLDPMVAHMASSWNAVEGAVATAARDLVRIGTAPAFESMKRNMQKIADLILDSNGQLTQFGRIITNAGEMLSNKVARVLDSLADKAKAFGENLANAIDGAIDMEWVDRMDRLFARMHQLGGMAGIGGPASGRSKAAGALAGGAAMGLAVNMMPGGFLVKMLLGPLATAFGAAAGPALGGVIEKFGIVDKVTAAFERMWGWLETLGRPLSILAGSIEKLMGQFLDVDHGFAGFNVLLGMVGRGLDSLVKGILDFAAPFIDLMAPVFVPLVQGLIALMAKLAEVVGSVLSGFGALLKKLYEWGYGEPAGTAKQLDNNGNVMYTQRGVEKDPTAQWSKMFSLGNAGGTGFSDMLKKLLEMPNKVKEASEAASKSAARTPPKRPTGNTVQDFRGSRFTIQQDFAKNFDPDRIAVAFAKDVGKIGEQRLQSGFEPLFGVG